MVEPVVSEAVQLSCCLYFAHYHSVHATEPPVCALKLKVVYEQLPTGMKVLYKFNVMKGDGYGA